MTHERFLTLPNDRIFGSGFQRIRHPWVDIIYPEDLTAELVPVLDDDMLTKVKWVAVKGQIDDWAIYHSISGNLVPPHNNYFNNEHLSARNQRVADWGTKVLDPEVILRMMPCDKNTLDRYRY